MGLAAPETCTLAGLEVDETTADGVYLCRLKIDGSM